MKCFEFSFSGWTFRVTRCRVTRDNGQWIVPHDSLSEAADVLNIPRHDERWDAFFRAAIEAMPEGGPDETALIAQLLEAARKAGLINEGDDFSLLCSEVL